MDDDRRKNDATNVLIRKLSAETVRGLKMKAAEHNTSMEADLRALLTVYAKGALSQGNPLSDAPTNRARWKATVFYRTDSGTLDVLMFLDELADLQGRVELGPHWDTIERIVVERINYNTSPTLTIEGARRG